jgi:two-component system response regulator HydG
MMRVLLVDDEPSIRRGVRRYLEHHGAQVTLAENLASARSAIATDCFDVMLVDLRLPDGEGLELVREQPAIPSVIMTSYASVPTAVAAMKMGARDYLAKPFDHDAMLLTLRAVTRSHAGQEPAEDSISSEEGGLLGEDPQMKRLRRQLNRIAATDSPVLILGESGTGKELAAHALHRLGPRRDRPFVAVNCASIPDGLVEAELFGHAQGAYTGAVRARDGLIASADGGVLFLDEIGELAPAAQARLLRVLQEGEIRPIGANASRRVDFRLVAATHRNLEEMVHREAFRADLYYRLRVLELQLPPLRNRPSDIPLLCRRFLAELGQRFDRPGLELSENAMERMQSYPWPGNVRELRHALERAVIMAEQSSIDWDQLGLRIPDAQGTEAHVSLSDYFRRFVLEHQDHMSETELARALGISRKTLWERRQRENLPRP